MKNGYNTRVGGLPDTMASVRGRKLYDPLKVTPPSGRTLLKGGTLVDPANGVEAVKDIAIQGEYNRRSRR